MAHSIAEQRTEAELSVLNLRGHLRTLEGLKTKPPEAELARIRSRISVKEDIAVTLRWFEANEAWIKSAWAKREAANG